MATKTFKIGERCRGGIIQAIAAKDKVTIIGKDWDTSAGYNKGSNQSNAKEWTRIEVQTSDSNARRKLSEFLEDLTTYYYSEKVIEWVESQTAFKSSFGW
jgi:hypothetical protein